MDSPTAFAAVALAAVAWDGVLGRAGTRSLRHELDYRPPFKDSSDQEMITLMNGLLTRLRNDGAEPLMIAAAGALDGCQRQTAFAVAAELMRSDGPLVSEEQRILAHLSEVLELPAATSTRILEVMDILHANVLEPGEG